MEESTDRRDGAIKEHTLDAHVVTSVVQAIHFAEALLKGEKDRKAIVRDVLADKIREVV